MTGKVYKIDPLSDARWDRFLARHPQATVFHSKQWLLALNKSYGYDPVAFTTSGPEEELSNAVVFCQIKSWLTGSRLVSLPFSDHCQPLATGVDLQRILESVQSDGQRLKYLELRPLLDNEYFLSFEKNSTFRFHTIDLRPQIQDIYKKFHDSCVRRKIKKAEKEGLTYESGNSEQLLSKFRQLLILTRRRHKLPPQPIDWHRNLIRAFGNALSIHLVSKDKEPVASILTLAFKKTLVYKYGCSDSKYGNLGGTPLLFWKAIQEGKQNGIEELDLGRSATEDVGLIAFKEHLGGVATDLSYYRYPAAPLPSGDSENKKSWAREVIASLPDPAFSFAGRLYRHLG